jgi:hypothetical protein
MAIKVTMPRLSDTDGRNGSNLAQKVGDKVAVSLSETDKATMEFESSTKVHSLHIGYQSETIGRLISHHWR